MKNQEYNNNNNKVKLDEGRQYYLTFQYLVLDYFHGPEHPRHPA